MFSRVCIYIVAQTWGAFVFSSQAATDACMSKPPSLFVGGKGSARASAILLLLLLLLLNMW